MEVMPGFMHMLKHDWEITFTDLFKERIKDSDKWCPFIHNEDKSTNFSCYQINPGLISTINFLEPLNKTPFKKCLNSC